MNRFLLGIAAIVLASIFALPATAGAVPAPGLQGAIVSKAHVNSDWTRAKFSYIAMYDLGFKPGGNYYGWRGYMASAPAGDDNCPDRILESGALKIDWDTGVLSPETPNFAYIPITGPETIKLDGKKDQEFCVYLAEYPTKSGPPMEYSLGSVPIVAFPDRGMTKRKAIALAKSSLAKSNGKSWRKGSSKKVHCREAKAFFNCKTTWKYKGRKKRGSVVVTKLN